MITLVLAAAASLGALACTQPAGSPTPAERSSPAGATAASCSEANLPTFDRDLIHAADPATLAAQQRIRFEDGRVAIRLRLVAEETDLAAAHDLRVIGRAAAFLDALAPLGGLCALSHDPRVGVIEVPYAPAPAA
jgi:hypothetical protein